MLISDYLKLRGNVTFNPDISANSTNAKKTAGTAADHKESPFAKELQSRLNEKNNATVTTGVEFSKHALERLNDRQIDLSEDDKLERLNKAVEIAAEKGSNETLVLLDHTAFVVSVKNNKVITTLSQADLQGNIFTNIDSTVIM